MAEYSTFRSVWIPEIQIQGFRNQVLLYRVPEGHNDIQKGLLAYCYQNKELTGDCAVWPFHNITVYHNSNMCRDQTNNVPAADKATGLPSADQWASSIASHNFLCSQPD